MAFPESPNITPVFETPPTREQLRQSLIADPYNAIIRSVEDIAEQARDQFESLAPEVPENQESIVNMYRELLTNNFAQLLQKVSEERDARLTEFDKQPEEISADTITKWYSGVATKAASLQVAYTSRAREIQNSAVMPLTQFANAHNR